jgi:hypothetical protein
MAYTIVGMPFRKELRVESGECRVSDITNEITQNGHAIANRHIEAESPAVFEKRLH